MPNTFLCSNKQNQNKASRIFLGWLLKSQKSVVSANDGDGGAKVFGRLVQQQHGERVKHVINCVFEDEVLLHEHMPSTLLVLVSSIEL